jgi:hypothetical protein
MSIEAFRQAEKQAPRHGNPSWFEIYTAQMTDEQREGLIEALRDPTIKHATIARVMKGWGYEVSGNSVGHWRRQNVG